MLYLQKTCSATVEGLKGTLAAIRTKKDLEEELSRPSKQDIEFASTLEGAVLILGAGGEMGPTLAWETVPLGMGYFNVIWPGDANSCAFHSLGVAKTPPKILNVTGPEIVSVREVAHNFGDRFGLQ